MCELFYKVYIAINKWIGNLIISPALAKCYIFYM